MKTLLFLTLAFTPLLIFSQSVPQQWEWARSFGGSGTDSAVDIKIKNGFLYVTGTFTSPQINWDNKILNNAGGKDIFIAKLDTNGNTIWVEGFGGTGDENVKQLEVNNNGDAAIWCTSTANSIGIGSSTLTNPANFYIKVDKDGHLLNSNVPPASCVYEDFDIGDDGSVYFSGHYSDVFNFAGQVTDTSKAKKGAVIFKYNADGSEEWAKYIVLYPNPFYPGYAVNQTPSMRIEYSGFDNSLSFLYDYCLPAFYTDSVYNFPESSDFSHLGNPPVIEGGDVGKITDTTLDYLSASYPEGTFHGEVSDFETGNNGLHFSYYSAENLVGYWSYIRKDFDETRQIIRKWFEWSGGEPDTGDVVNIAKGTLRTSETGMYILFNSGNATNNLEILDTNLISKKLISIPAFGQQTWCNKSFTDTNAVYFADSYYNAAVQLNNNVPGLTIIPIHNNGICNIFIGKYFIQSNPGITLAPSPDRYRICSDSIALNLSVISGNSSQLTYHWSPSFIVSDSAILNPKVFTTADSAVATLTITDAEGDHFAKDFTFIKGSLIDLRLVPSDTIVCRGDTINLSLAGTQFIPCYYSAYGSYLYTPTQIFNSITDTKKYVMNGDQNLTLNPYDDPNLPPSEYCIASGVQIRTSKTFDTNYVKICQGGSYVFPNGHQAVYVRHPLTYTCTINGTSTCDSVITTYLDVDTLPAVTEVRNVCRGGTFTFPDGWTVTDVQSDITYTSYLHSSSGCDTMTITTVMHVVDPTNTIQDTSVCKGGSYTFPDYTMIADIQSPVSHISHLQTIYGCDSIIITNVNLINIDTAVTKNGKTLTANFNDGNYQWLNCDDNYSEISDSTNQSFIASFVGDYAVKISSQGCTDTSGCYSITADDLTLGIKMQVNVYPTPTKNTFKIAIKSLSYATVNLILYNFQGNKIRSTKANLQPGITVISQNISNLASGTYTLELINTQTGEAITKTILKN